MNGGLSPIKPSGKHGKKKRKEEGADGDLNFNPPPPNVVVNDISGISSLQHN